MIKNIFWLNETDTQQWAHTLAQQWLHSTQPVHMLICLHGDLGAGKTTLVRYILRSLGVEGRIKSPTFAIVESYDTTVGKLWHFDLYRFDNPQEWEDAGFGEICATNGIKFIEWADKAAHYLPVADWDVYLEQSYDAAEHARQVRIEAHTPYGKDILSTLHGN